MQICPSNSWVLMHICNASFAYSTTQQKEYGAQEYYEELFFLRGHCAAPAEEVAKVS
jgi:hypothetical protein